MLLGQTIADTIVFAASSTTDVLRECASAFEKQGGKKVRFNFASSGTLARQIEAGAPADVFISANAKWMDQLQEKNFITPDSRFNAAANRLVLIAPHGSEMKFDESINERIAVGDFKGVPVGMYAREALSYMGWLENVQMNLVRTSNARMVLMYVERGEVGAGIVYSSDAKSSDRVITLGTFPAESHSPIIYPAAACSKKETALRFLAFLKSKQAKAILQAHGFTEPKN